MVEASIVDRLTLLRDQLEGLLRDADDKTAPALSREYRSVLSELEKLCVKEASSVDDLAARRSARLAEAKSSQPAEVRKRGSRTRGDRSS